jgi:hypothetical protein
LRFSNLNSNDLALSVKYGNNILLVSAGDGKFPEIFTGGNFPTMFAHRSFLAYFLPIIYVSGYFLPYYL